MAFFERADIRGLSVRLLALEAGQGIPLTSRAGQELHAMLSAVDGIRPVGRGAARQLTDRGHLFLTTKLKETNGEPSWSGERVLAALEGHLPHHINAATLSGLWLRDCKAALSPTQLARADELGVRVYGDEVLRLRCGSSLSLLWQDGRRYCADEGLQLLGELALPERALDRLRGIEWQGRQIVTVENKGAFVDYPLQPQELLLYVPGRNTTLAKQLIPLLPAATPWAHFGDLDQRGLDIAAELASTMTRPLALWLPENLMEYVHHYARDLTRPSEGQQSRRGKIPWRDRLVTAKANDVLTTALAHLVANKAWLEQEVLVTARRWRSWPRGDMPAS
ncbi:MULTISPECIES: Wadjet anti-phage system protein JetD domain-containing protein [Aeromonas]|uniref:Wadjet anti-phage system protein JetD domain-containing protein n=1 Tax=Aeromonas TaxID=642 RepID=UPI001F4B8C6B|nr:MULTISPECIES: Wadjet anti-phage system protein JetD domain-containing protein [Aeromonas]MCH7373162.1 DUF2220 family protein [Aeromonas sp. MR16]